MIKRKYGNQGWVGYMFLTPWIIGFFGLILGPMIYSLYLSFTDYSLLSAPRWVGLDNFENMFQDRNYIDSVKVTLTFVLLAVPLELLAALGVALLLNKGLKGLGIYRTMYYIPSLLGGSVAVALLWKNIFGVDGLINQLLAYIGIEGRGWVSHPDYALYTLIILSAWQFGSAMVIFLAGLKQIPGELYEAASVDGANSFSRFWKITLPMLSPVLFFNLIMKLISSMQVFTSSYIVSEGTGGPINSTLFYTLYLYQKGFSHFEMGYASAMAWLLLIVLAVMTGILFLTSRYWVYYDDGGKS